MMTVRLLRPLAFVMVASTAALPQALRGQGHPVIRPSASWVGAPLDEYVRLLQLSGEVPLSSRLLRPNDSPLRGLAFRDSSPLADNPWRGWYAARPPADTSHFVMGIYDPLVRMTENSAVPFGANDGAMWAGRGLSVAADFGAVVEYGPLMVRLAPTVTWSQNADFVLGGLHPRFVNGVAQANSLPADMSSYADPYMSFNIDMPQRFGERALSRIDWGQSVVGVSGFGLRASVGTENMWWGPGQENALLMTNNAGGLPHFGLGTKKAVDIGLGRLEALYTVGLLRGSGYWRQSAADSLARRWMNALSFVIEPRGAPGLYLGASRMFYAFRPANGIPASELLEIFQPFTKSAFQTDSNPTGNDARDQMISVFGRWVMPKAQFEVYGELGRNDHPVDIRDLVLEPDHSAAYVAGLQKLFLVTNGFYRLGAELSDLAGGLTTLVRAQPTWYTHFIVRPGYTQRGQVVGAGIGPGGQSRSLRLDRMSPRGSVGGFVHWQRQNTDAYFSEHVGQFQRNYHDVFLGVGARGSWIMPQARLSGEFLRQKEYNRYGILLNDVVNYHVRLIAEIRLF